MLTILLGQVLFPVNGKFNGELESSRRAVYTACELLTRLGYTLSRSKRAFEPSKQI